MIKRNKGCDVMNRFIYCFDEEMRNRLLENGYNLINSKCIDNKTTYIFENIQKLSFSHQDIQRIHLTNKMTF